MNKKWIFLLFPVLLLAILFMQSRGSENAQEVKKDPVETTKSEKVYKLEKMNEASDEYKDSDITNILIIGVDEGGFEDARSDVMIIASVNPKKDSVKLTSVMRDTLAYIPSSNTYQKLNHSYMEGGPEETMLAFNENFDLDIEDYVVFDFKSVEKVVDLVGGYPATVNGGESVDTGLSVGDHVLSGEQAVDYIRARKNSGGDTGRNQRQRDLMEYVMKEAMKLGKKDMLSLVGQVLPSVKTSYSLKDVNELWDIYGVIGENLSIQQNSFPSEYVGTTLDDKLWYAVPNSMSSNVKQLHQEIYETEELGLKSRVENISNEIKNKSGVY